MAFKKNYFQNLSQSPVLQTQDNTQDIIENNKRINAEREKQFKAYQAEQTHVDNATSNLNSVIENTYQGDYTREVPKTDSLGNTYSKDVTGGELMDDNTWNWLNDDDRSTCVSYSCAIAGKAGMRVPMNDTIGPDEQKGGIKIYEEKKNGGQGGYVWYNSGDPMPIVPWNQRFDLRSEDLGFELQPKGTLPIEGDFIREGYDTPYFDQTDPKAGLYSGTGHSVIATDTIRSEDDKLTGAYASDTSRGLLQNEVYTRDNNFISDNEAYPGLDRIQRYVGSLPYLDSKNEEWRNNPDNKLKSWTASFPEAKMELLEPSSPEIIIQEPGISLTPKQKRKYER